MKAEVCSVLYDGNMGCLRPRRTFSFCPFHDLSRKAATSTEDELLGKQVLANEKVTVFTFYEAIAKTICLAQNSIAAYKVHNHPEFFCVLAEFVVIRKASVPMLFYNKQLFTVKLIKSNEIPHSIH